MYLVFVGVSVCEREHVWYLVFPGGNIATIHYHFHWLSDVISTAWRGGGGV